MQLFFEKNIIAGTQVLQVYTARHITQVLRKDVGYQFALTNGAGVKARATISSIHKKECLVLIDEIQQHVYELPHVHLAIAFTKNASRMEWLLEKATEIGLASITPLITQRSENIYPKTERLQHILQSALCQSQQYFLPALQEKQTIAQVLLTHANNNKMIAHCMEQPAKLPLVNAVEKNKSSLILIGPEGDFTAEEVSLCLQQGCKSISLGKTRLRTETAGLLAVSIVQALHHL